MDALPASISAALDLIVKPNTIGNFIVREIKKSHFQPAAQITDARAGTQVRVCRPKPHLCYETIDRCIGHSIQIVIANVGAAADAQHAQKKRRENDLHSEEQPHRPEEHLPDLLQRTESARCPLPCNVRTSRQPAQKEQTANQQSRFERYAFQNTL